MSGKRSIPKLLAARYTATKPASNASRRKRRWARIARASSGLANHWYRPKGMPHGPYSSICRAGMWRSPLISAPSKNRADRYSARLMLR
ncbi:hypothetical protein D3C79_908740 [compost metagenome]